MLEDALYQYFGSACTSRGVQAVWAIKQQAGSRMGLRAHSWQALGPGWAASAHCRCRQLPRGPRQTVQVATEVSFIMSSVFNDLKPNRWVSSLGNMCFGEGIWATSLRDCIQLDVPHSTLTAG